VKEDPKNFLSAMHEKIVSMKTCQFLSMANLLLFLSPKRQGHYQVYITILDRASWATWMCAVETVLGLDTAIAGCSGPATGLWL
jgi:hypothetical protein